MKSHALYFIENFNLWVFLYVSGYAVTPLGLLASAFYIRLYIIFTYTRTALDRILLPTGLQSLLLHQWVIGWSPESSQ